MKLHWLQRLFRLALLIAVLGAALFSGYLVSGQARPTFLHVIAFEAQAACRDAGTQWMIAVCLCVYLIAFLVLERRMNPDSQGWHPFKANLWLAALAGVALAHYGLAYQAASSSTVLLVFLAGMTLCKGARVWARWPRDEQATAQRTGLVLGILVLLLVGGLVWRPEIGQAFQYRGQARWSGAWQNPNIYGLLMGVGIVLAGGQLVQSLRLKVQSHANAERRVRSAEVWRWSKFVFLLAGALAMSVGLVKSYSRGAWVAAACGIGFLLWNLRRANACLTENPHPQPLSPLMGEGGVGLSPSDAEKGARGGEGESARSVLECGDSSPLFPDAPGRVSQSADQSAHSTRRFALPLGIIVVSLAVLAFWNFRHTEQLVARRAFSVGNVNDFSWRNRAAAYEGALQMIADKPWFGFGWNKPEPVYYKFYQPNKLAEGMAIQMNDYFMLGTTLGLPALFCFGAYIWLSLTHKSGVRGQRVEVGSQKTKDRESGLWFLRATCRAGAIVVLVGFWFDGGLFKLATAAPFWILLELGREDLPQMDTDSHRLKS